MDARSSTDLLRLARTAALRGGPPLTVALAGLALATGLWWRDCVLLAGAGLLGLASFHARMHAGAPWSGLRAGLRCGSGGAGMLAAGLLLGWTAAIRLEAWSAPGAHPRGLLALAATAVISLSAVLASMRAGWGEWAWVAGAGLTAVLAAELADVGISSVACGFAGLAALFLVAQGWRLLRHTIPAMLRSEQRW